MVHQEVLGSIPGRVKFLNLENFDFCDVLGYKYQCLDLNDINHCGLVVLHWAVNREVLSSIPMRCRIAGPGQPCKASTE